MSNRVRITFDYTLDRPITPEILDAIGALASVMDVQSEDGVYTLGSPDSDDVENVLEAHISDADITIEAL